MNGYIEFTRDEFPLIRDPEFAGKFCTWLTGKESALYSTIINGNHCIVYPGGIIAELDRDGLPRSLGVDGEAFDSDDVKETLSVAEYLSALNGDCFTGSLDLDILY